MCLLFFLNPGYPVSHFLQKDLSQSMVYYRHLGNEVFDDSFEVVMSDFHDPPNLSEPQVGNINISVFSKLIKENMREIIFCMHTSLD